MKAAARPLVASLLLALAPATQALAQSCAMCGSSFGQNDPVQRAFSWSILFLMATPYTIVGAVALWLVYMHRRAAGRRRSAGGGVS
jgi:heme/copper-type cytochrome/quinol oxidase subunit 2